MAFAILPFSAFIVRAEEYTEYTIVGWENIGPEGAIKSVKIDGVELPETEGSITKAPGTDVEVEIVLNENYWIGVFPRVNEYREVLRWKGEQSGNSNLYSSGKADIIMTPPEDCLKDDHEICLLIPTEGWIDSVSLTISQPLCGTSVKGTGLIDDETDDSVRQTPQPEVTLPDGARYELDEYEDENYGIWITADEDDFEGTMRDEKYRAMLWLRPKGGNLFSEDLAVSVSGGGLIDSGLIDESLLQVVVEVDLLHEWGEWTVTKEPTATEEGLETRVCKYDPDHTETRPILIDSPNTGDSSSTGLWAALLVVTLPAVIILVFTRRKLFTDQR